MKSKITLRIENPLFDFVNIPTYNHGQSICRLFHVLAQFPFTTSDRKWMFELLHECCQTT